jgi:hypothetical protein
MPDDRLGVSHQLCFDAIADADPRHLRLFEVAVDPIAVHTAVYNVFNFQRYLSRRATLHSFRAQAHQAWDNATVAA